MQKSVTAVCSHCSFARLKNKQTGVPGTGNQFRLFCSHNKLATLVPSVWVYNEHPLKCLLIEENRKYVIWWFFLPNFDHFVIVYINWSLILRTFYLLFLDDHMVQAQANHKGVERYIFHCFGDECFPKWDFEKLSIVSITRCKSLYPMWRLASQSSVYIIIILQITLPIKFALKTVHQGCTWYPPAGPRQVTFALIGPVIYQT